MINLPSQPITIIPVDVDYSTDREDLVNLLGIILDIHAHSIIISDSNRIVSLSPISSDLNILQDFGINSRKIEINGVVNRNIDTTTFAHSMILDKLRFLKNNNIKILIMTNTTFLFARITHLTTKETNDKVSSYDYTIQAIETHLQNGMYANAISQSIYNAMHSIVGGIIPSIFNTDINGIGELIIP